MTFKEAIQSCLQKYASFKGRAPRSEYWFFVLFIVIADIAAMFVDKILGTTFKIGGLSIGYGYIYCLVALALLLPAISVAVRRLHDTNRSGWWYWIALIPLIGGILLIVWFATKGTAGSNKFGQDPLQPASDVFG